MRISDNMRLATARVGQNAIAERLDKVTRQAATGLRVLSASDDIVSFASGLRRSAQKSQIENRAKNVGRAHSDMVIAEGALASATDVMNRAREIATQMANGSYDASARASSAKEVQQLGQQLLGLASTQGSDGFLFGGTRNDVPPWQAATGATAPFPATFVGNTGRRDVEIAEGVYTRANLDTSAAFGSSFAALSALHTALSSNNAAGITNAIGVIADGHRQLTDVRADGGMALDRLQSAQAVSEGALTRVNAALAKDIEADALETFAKLDGARSAFERSVEVTKKILSISSSIG